MNETEDSRLDEFEKLVVNAEFKMEESDEAAQYIIRIISGPEEPCQAMSQQPSPIFPHQLISHCIFYIRSPFALW